MGIPILSNYYKAVVLDQIKWWWSPPEGKIWAALEAGEFPLHNPKLSLIAARMGLAPITSTFPAVQVSLRIWKDAELVKEHDFNSTSVWTPIDVLSLFIPDLNLYAWKTQGLLCVADVTSISGKLLDFQHLRDRFQRQHREYFKYMQIRHLWQKHSIPTRLHIYKPIVDHLQGGLQVL